MKGFKMTIIFKLFVFAVLLAVGAVLIPIIVVLDTMEVVYMWHKRRR